MDTLPWIIIAVLILLVAFAIVAIVMKKKYKTPTDYYAFFWIGIVWLIIGLPMKNYTLGILGIVFAVIGLANKSKWKTNRVTWNMLSPEQKKAKIAIIVILSILVVVGLVVYFLTEQGII